VPGMLGDSSLKTHVVEHKGLWAERGAWFLQASSYFFRRKGIVGEFAPNVGTNVPP